MGETLRECPSLGGICVWIEVSTCVLFGIDDIVWESARRSGRGKVILRMQRTIMNTLDTARLPPFEHPVGAIELQIIEQ